MWARGVSSGWGTTGELQFFVKLGSDESNFYMYRTPLSGDPGQAGWLPEIHVDFQKLIALRAQIQNAYLRGTQHNTCTGLDSILIANTPLPAGVASQARYAACADGYLAYTLDPGMTPPNLAAVQELAVGMIRTGMGMGPRPVVPGDTLELWVDDIRLGNAIDAVGFAGQVGIGIIASDFADIRANSLGRQDPNFRCGSESNQTFLTNSAM